MNKGIIISGIIGIIIITTTVILFSSVSDSENEEIEVEVEFFTGTPADNYLTINREKFCGTGEAKSNKYIKEYLIPTDCTQPLAIVTSPTGNVWFAQSNTGKLAKFNPATETFTEYDNSSWPKGDHSMIWGLDYKSDGTLWFTDIEHNAVWRFNTARNQYEVVPFPFPEDSHLQKIEATHTRIIINDFIGNEIVYFYQTQLFVRDLVRYSLPLPEPGAVTSAFTLDSNNILWFTNWIPEQEGSLVKINQTEFDTAIRTNTENIVFEFFSLPLDLKTPNGISEDSSGNIWIADSSSSLFFKFEPVSEEFTKYVTSDPPTFTYGNYTGQIKSAFSQPFWIEQSDSGKLVFNEPSANRIALFDPTLETLVEYSIPSKNPNWGDCDGEKNCGISQIFDFTVAGDKIWFTEWAENKIGVLDTTILLPIDVQLDTNRISLKPGETMNLNYVVSSDSQNTLEISQIIANPDSGKNLIAKLNSNEKTFSINSNYPLVTDVVIFALETAVSGEYKILLGATTNQVSFSKFLTVFVE